MSIVYLKEYRGPSMNYRAELFDQMQLLYEETGFNDHQLHCIIRLRSCLDESVLRRAVSLSLGAIPILATRYVARAGRSRWESLPLADLERAFSTADDETAFEPAVTYRIQEGLGPQLRLCLSRGEKSAVAITMNHMIADAGGFKDYLYFLCATYSHLMRDASYTPPNITGDRGIRDLLREFGLKEKIGALIAQKADSNRAGSLCFPFDSGNRVEPFIATRVVDRGKVARLKAYCKERGATINDAALAAYYRVLVRYIGPSATEGLEVPVMIDMRRYLKNKEFRALRNLASTTVTRLRLREDESFEETLGKAKLLMDTLKRQSLGLGGYAKISLLFGLCGDRLAFRLLRGALRHPLVCMTNIGELNQRRLAFDGVEVESAYMCGSIKRKPHFQLALSGFDGSLTLSSNLYGTEKDRSSIDAFLSEVEGELTV
jgi:NRPS condensation-like uncharacterized protein